MSTPLTLTHLRFDCVAREPLKLGGKQAGERLRNALAAVMLRAVCPETLRASRPTPQHAAVCPACWLLAAQADPGDVRRAYALVPPLPAPDLVEPGGAFSFTITLFGRGFQYLPYFILAAPEMGNAGVGPGRGRFELRAITAVSPLGRTLQPVLLPGEQTVRVPELVPAWEGACSAAAPLLANLKDGLLPLEFLTPTRLVYRLGEKEALLKLPAFDVFFRRLLERIDELSRQLAGADPRPREQIERLYDLAGRVRLVDADVAWVDVFSWSGRKDAQTPMGGFTGRAAYYSADWPELLPFLLFGQGVQAGKLAVKGNGVFQVRAPAETPYWEWLMQASPDRKPMEAGDDRRTTPHPG